MAKLNILLVEDDPIIGRDTQKILEFLGYHVSGPFVKAEDALSAEAEAHDVYIFDVELKGPMNGLELSEKLNSTSPKPTIFITGLLDTQVRKRALESGASAFLNKPFNERNLVNAIEIALENPVQPIKAKREENKPIFVKVNKRFIRIELDEIDFLEASGHYMVIHTGKNQYSSSISMSTFMAEHLSPHFLQTHRSYIVNMKKVIDFDDSHIYFSGKMVPISKSKQREFKSRLSII